MKQGQIPLGAVHLSLALLCLLSAFTFPVRGERLPIKTFTSADGLGSSFVDFLMRDSRGFMWFCTRDGLSRFDGSHFITYRIGDAAAPPGIESISETHDGTYWIGTTGGFYRFKSSTLSRADSPAGTRPTLNAEFVISWRGDFLEDGAGSLWLGADALYRIEEQNGKVTMQAIDLLLPTNPNRSFSIFNFEAAPDGSLWINSSWGLVRRLPDGRVIFYQSEPTTATQSSMSVLADAAGRIWLSRAYELWVINPEPLEALTNSPNISVRSLSATYTQPAVVGRDIQLPAKPGDILRFTPGSFLAKYINHRLRLTRDGHMWLTTDHDLIEFDGRAFHLYDDTQGLPAGMTQMAEDAAGNLWIGGRAALIRLDRYGLTSYTKADGLSINEVRGISESADGTCYFAQGNFDLARFDGGRLRSLHPQIPANAQTVWPSHLVFQSASGEWWFLTEQGLYRFAANTTFERLATTKPLAVYDRKTGLQGDAILQMFEDSLGDLWVSLLGTTTASVGLARLKHGERDFRRFSTAEGFPDGKSVSSYAEDRQGNLWFGFYEGGLLRYHGGRFTQISTADGLPAGVITDLLVDLSGRLWLTSSNGGVSHVDDTNSEHLQFVTMTINEGLASNNTRTITEDKFGNLYVGSVSGVDRISSDTKRIKHYSVGDGLAADFVTDSHCDRNGALWFATMNGLSRLVPRAAEQPAAPRIWLGGLRIAGVTQAVSELGQTELQTASLSYNQNNLQISFFGLDFRASENLRYQYRLAGADAGWSAPSEQRTITYANLQPGTYSFLVRAVNSEGVSSENPAILRFKILPPIWRRWWFVTLAVLFLGGVALSVVRYRVAQTRERRAAEEQLRRAREERLAELERVRKRIATDLHDDIGSSLTRISLLSEVAQRQGGGNGNLSGPLTVIAGLSRELVDSMSDIVWAINPHKDSFGDLTQRMRHFASDVFTAREIDLQFRLPESAPPIRVGANLRRELYLIFKEAVNNSVRHSGCSEAAIEFQFTAESFSLQLSDNGCGFDVARESRGHGLASMRDRVAGLSGTLEVVSHPGEGTRISLVIPLVKHETALP